MISGRTSRAYLAMLIAIGWSLGSVPACSGRNERHGREVTGDGRGGALGETSGAGEGGGPPGNGGVGVGGTEVDDGGATFAGGTGAAGGVGEAGSGGSPLEPRCDPAHVYDGYFSATDPAELEGLRYYNEVTGSVTLTGSISDLSALECLTRVGGHLTLRNLTASTLAGLSALERVEGTFIIEDLESLADLDALLALKLVHALQINDNEGLTSIAGLAGLESSPADVQIYLNASLTSLVGLEATTGPTDVRIFYNPSLADVEGLSGLTGGWVHMVQNSLLTDVEGLRNFTSGDLEFRGHERLTTLEGLRNFRDGGYVSVSDSPVLSNLHGLEQLSGATVVLRELPLLTDLAGLGSANALEIVQNAALETLDGVTVSADMNSVTLEANPSLVDLGALSNVASCGILQIADNAILTDLSPLSNVTQAERLVVEDNPALRDLDGFQQVTILNELRVERNATLSSLQGLDGLTAVTDRFFITENPVLPTCEAERLRDHIGIANIGYASIADNDDTGVCP